MTDFSDAYSTQELATMFCIAVKNLLKRASRENWQSQPRVGRGGGREWLVASMPEDTRAALALAVQEAQPSEILPMPAVVDALPAILNTVELKNLSHKERTTVMARLAFVREIQRHERTSCRGVVIGEIVSAAKAGTLPARLAELVPYANSRYGSGAGRGVSRRRLYDWCAAYDEFGEAGLIPHNPQKNMTPPAWLQLFLHYWQRPQKPSVTAAHADFTVACTSLLNGVSTGLPLLTTQNDAQRLALVIAEEVRAGIPSEHAARRWLAKMSMPEREAGRRTGNALLALRPHKLRQTKDLLPTDVYTADGTTADVEVLHPDHGQPFKPELTFVVDVATRRCVGVSVGLAENRFTVLDALRMACLVGGIPAIFYTDNGPGYRNEMMDAKGVGLLDRLGTECASSIPGRPQGKGLMERAVQTLTRRLCKQFASCTRYDMDADAAKKVYKLSRKQIKETGSTSLLPTWGEFLEALKRHVAFYNAKPHSKLPCYKDERGRLRHFSPDEYWQQFEADDWEPVRVPEYLHDELFMPSEERVVCNGWVRFYNAKYFSSDLADWHGEKVAVRYDIWDSSKLYIWTRDGRKICTAELDGNAIPYFTPTRVEKAREKRKSASIHRLEKKAQVIAPGAVIALPEADDSVVLDVVDSVSRNRVSMPAQSSVEPQVLREIELKFATPEPAAERSRPMFEYPSERYEWLMLHPGLWTSADRDFVPRYVQTAQYADYQDIFKAKGIAWEDQCANFS